MKLFSVFMMSCALTLAGGLAPAMAQTNAKKTVTPPSAEAKNMATSPAYRLYDQTVVECFGQVMEVNPFDAARKKDMSGMNMDRDDIMALQDCMKDKGVDANFENYYGAAPKSGQSTGDMSAAQKADLQELEKRMREGKAPAPGTAMPTPGQVQAVAPRQVPPPVAPARDIQQAPSAIPPTTPAESQQPTDQLPASSGESKPRSKSGKYWNSTGE